MKSQKRPKVVRPAAHPERSALAWADKRLRAPARTQNEIRAALGRWRDQVLAEFPDPRAWIVGLRTWVLLEMGAPSLLRDSSRTAELLEGLLEIGAETVKLKSGDAGLRYSPESSERVASVRSRTARLDAMVDEVLQDQVDHGWLQAKGEAVRLSAAARAGRPPHVPSAAEEPEAPESPEASQRPAKKPTAPPPAIEGRKFRPLSQAQRKFLELLEASPGTFVTVAPELRRNYTPGAFVSPIRQHVLGRGENIESGKTARAAGKTVPADVGKSAYRLIRQPRKSRRKRA